MAATCARTCDWYRTIPPSDKDYFKSQNAAFRAALAAG